MLEVNTIDIERGRIMKLADDIQVLISNFMNPHNFESKVTVGVDKHGNPRSGRSPTLTSSGPSRRELIPYLKKAGMKNVPSISNKLFWEEVKAYAEWRKELLVIHWYVPVDRL